MASVINFGDWRVNFLLEIAKQTASNSQNRFYELKNSFYFSDGISALGVRRRRNEQRPDAKKCTSRKCASQYTRRRGVRAKVGIAARLPLGEKSSARKCVLFARKMRQKFAHYKCVKPANGAVFKPVEKPRRRLGDCVPRGRIRRTQRRPRGL